MKCPLIVAGWNATRGGDKAFPPDCLTEECAWWRKEYPACCIYSIERAMWAIAAELRRAFPIGETEEQQGETRDKDSLPG